MPYTTNSNASVSLHGNVHAAAIVTDALAAALELEATDNSTKSNVDSEVKRT